MLVLEHHSRPLRYVYLTLTLNFAVHASNVLSSMGMASLYGLLYLLFRI